MEAKYSPQWEKVRTLADKAPREAGSEPRYEQVFDGPGTWKLCPFCGREIGRYPLHLHSFHEILLIQEGQADYMVEGRIFRAAPGDVAVVPAGHLHRPTVLQPRRDYRRTALWVRDAFLAELPGRQVPWGRLFEEVATRQHFFIGGDTFYGRAVGAMMGQLAALPPEFRGREAACRALVAQIVLYACNALQPGGAALPAGSVARDPIVSAALQIINSHLAEPLTLDRLAASCYVSKFHLVRLFRAYTGLTPHQYILSKRLQQARRLLAQGVPATRAAIQCGFEHYSGFYDAFKKHTGCTPGQFAVRRQAESPEGPAAEEQAQ